MNRSEEPNEQKILEFEKAWSAGHSPKISDHLPPAGESDYLSTLKELVIIDLEFRWKQSSTANTDKPISLEAYLREYHSLSDESTLSELIAEEFSIRHKYGDRPTEDSYLGRFPQFEQLIKKLTAEHHDCAITNPKPLAAHRACDRIGQYQLIKEIGVGGMGSVFLALQEHPVRRTVALKLIRSGFDSKEIIARFDAERQAMAMMDHQHIARIYEAGTTVLGVPYFVMEYVEGTPITDYCRINQLSISQRLSLFLDLCAAVQHAHQKGIIHRDLKPSNVLVARQEDQPVIKVIDFGLAKALDANMLLTEHTMQTHPGQVLGTVKYMSPEQAASDEQAIDTRTDIYSLGVILYELLTGETPLDMTQLEGYGMLSLLEHIRDFEPVRPSKRLMLDKALATRITATQKITSDSLQALLKGDLDWVIMKAMEHDLSRRYETVSSFAEDLIRFLNKEPVLARPPSTSYRLQKFVLKNRLLVTSAAVALTVLVTGIVLTTWLAIRAMNAEQIANTERTNATHQATIAQQQRQAAERSRDNEQQARFQAEAAATQAKRFLQFVVDSFHSADPMQGAKKEMLARDVLTQALRDAPIAMQDEPLIQVEILTALSESLSGLGEYELSRQAALSGVTLLIQNQSSKKELFAVINNLLADAYLNLGKYQQAHNHYYESLVMLCAEDATAHQAVYDLQIRTASGTKSRKEILTVSPLAIETLTGMFNTYVAAKKGTFFFDIQEMIYAAECAVALLGPADPITLSAYETLADVQMLYGDREEAIRLQQEVLSERLNDKGKQAPETIAIMLKLGQTYAANEQFDNAIKIGLEAVVSLKERLGVGHPQTGEAMCQVGEYYRLNHSLDESIEIYSEVYLHMIPGTLTHQRATRGYAKTLILEGKWDKALEVNQYYFYGQIWVHLLNRKPKLAAMTYQRWIDAINSPEFSPDLNLRLISVQQWAEEYEALENTLKVYEQPIRQTNPPGYVIFECEYARAEILIGKGDFAEAEKVVNRLLKPTIISKSNGLKGLPGFENLTGPGMSHALSHSDQTHCLLLLALCKAEQGVEPASQIPAALKAFETLHSAIGELPDFYCWWILRAAKRVGRIYELADQPEEARKWAEKLSDLEQECFLHILEEDLRIDPFAAGNYRLREMHESDDSVPQEPFPSFP